MKRILIVFAIICAMASVATAQSNTNRITFGVGALYERGLDATLSVEHETKYHNAWEYFVNGYVKWVKCPDCHHVCPDSFWNNYRTWNVGVAYKPCVARGRNHYANFRFGGGIGADTHEVIGTVHLGYEHSYVLPKGWQLYWQVKTDFIINGEDLFRSGIVLGIKIPN